MKRLTVYFDENAGPVSRSRIARKVSEMLKPGGPTRSGLYDNQEREAVVISWDAVRPAPAQLGGQAS